MTRRILALISAVLAIAAATAAQSRAEPADPAEREPTATERADLALVMRFFDASKVSPDMRLRVLVGTMPNFTNDGALTGTTVVPIDVLAEQARGSTDPMVLALLVAPCENDRLKPRPTCDALDMARRWTVAETQNQIAWLTLSSVLHDRKDEAASRAAFERASQASVWHEYYDEGVRTYARAIPPGLSPARRHAVLTVALSTPAVVLVPHAALQALNLHCKNPDLRAACLHILDTVDRDSGSLLSSQVGENILKRMALPDGLVAARAQKLDAIRWASIESANQLGDDASTPDPVSVNRRLERRIALGELPWGRAWLQETGMSDAVAAARYRQYRQDMAARNAADARAKVN